MIILNLKNSLKPNSQPYYFKTLIINSSSHLVLILAFLSICLFPRDISAQTQAFPSIKGAGKNITGGRGGYVVKVTNLNNSGPGSLREAMLKTGTRTIVFDVSGTINITSPIEMILENSNLTIAGQTAPEGGITISGYWIKIGGGFNKAHEPSNNIIIRYIRFRNGAYNGQPDYGRSNGVISSGCSGLIFDHCSFSFCGDQALSLGGDYGVFEDLTVQRCTFSDSGTMMIIGTASQAFPTRNITVTENAFIDTTQRTPNMGSSGQYDIINNYYFNWTGRLSNLNGANGNSPEVNYIGNYMKEGSSTSPGSGNKYQSGDPAIYTANNYHSSLYTTPQLDDRNIWKDFWTGGAVSSSRFTTTMHPLLGDINISSALDVPNILSDVGANRYLNEDGTYGIYQDSYDLMKISNANNGISTTPNNLGPWTLPIIPVNTRPASYDTDNDGMADVWEVNSFNTLSHDGTEDTDNDGYTDLEEFLNGTDPSEGIVIIDNDVVISSNHSNDTICEGESITLTASPADSYIWNTGATTSSITVSPTNTNTYSVTAQFSNGGSAEDDLTVYVNNTPSVSAGQNQTINAGQSVTLTATGANSYSWNTGQLSSSITVSPASTTTYSVTGNSNGCDDSDSVTVFVESTNETVNADIAGGNFSICSGLTTTLVASGGSTYLWNTGETASNITIAPTVTTTYTVTAFSASGNTQDQDSVTITVNDAPNVNAGPDQTILPDESVTLTASGANTYLWNTGQSTPSITVSPNSTTTYSVTGNKNGCLNTDNVTVVVQDNNVTANISAEDDTLCYGSTTTLTASGGSTYLWSTGETTSSITVMPTETSTYTVTAYNASGNGQDQDSIVITVNDPVNANAGNDVTICEGSSTTLTAFGGTSYLWSTGANSQSITVSPNQSMTYSVEVFNNGCSNVGDVTVNVKSVPNISAGNNVTIIQGQSTTLSASGGNSYLWNTGQSSPNITVSPNSTTTYSVTGFSDICEGTDQVTVFVQTENVTANAGPNVTICKGETTTLTAIGGSSYEWNTGETTQSIEVSPTISTTYSVTAFSATGANEDSDSVTVIVNNLPVINAGNNLTITLGDSTTLTASGADSYAWSTGQTTPSITVSPNSTTTYAVTGFSNGCEATDQVTVIVQNDNSNETVNADIGGGNFSICSGTMTTLVAYGGSSYLWSTGETTTSIAISPTETTTYTLIAYSESGNTQDQDSITVSVYGHASAGEDVAICLGNSTTLTATSGESYQWSTGETTQSITVSPSATTVYSVVVTEKFCTSSDDVTVTISESLNVNAGNDVNINQGASTTLTATGADSYLWSTGATTASINVNPNSTTTYSVTGFSNSCEGTDEVTVTVQGETVAANAGSDVTICDGETTTLTATGGTTYLWNTGQTSASISVTPGVTTTYYVTAYGSIQSNSDQDSVTVTVNPLPTVNAGSNVTIFQGDNTTLTAAGAVSYVWSTGETSSSITVSPNSTTTYSVTGYSNGCEATDQVTVFVENDNSNETVNADIGGGNFSICAGTTTTLVAYGGSSYLWSTGETTTSIAISPTETTTYTLIAYSESGNTQDQDSITVSVYGHASAGEDVAICLGNSTTLTATSGESYQWSTGETTQSITVSPSVTTVYSVEVSEKFCTSSDEVMVSVNESLNVNAGNDTSIEQGAFATLTATGADSYQWSTGGTTASINVNPNSTTTYTVTGFSNGCEGTDTVTVIVQDEEIEIVNADIGGGNYSICSGTTTTLSAYGGSSYLWSTGQTTSTITITPSVTTTYTVTAYSESGNSQDQDSVTISVNNVQVDAGNDVTILEGESTVLTASGAEDYLWSTGETTESITVDPLSTKTYTVTGYFKGCEASDAVTVTVESATIRSKDLVEFIVFQNSVSGMLNAQIIGLDDALLKRLTITNMNGKVLFREALNSSEYEKSIDVSRFAKGIYAIRLTYNDETIVKKVVIK